MSVERKLVRMEVENLEELVLLVSSTPAPIINLDSEKKIAFAFLSPLAALTPIIYYCRLSEIPSARFAHFNRVNAKIRFSDEFSAEPHETNIPIIRVKAAELGL